MSDWFGLLHKFNRNVPVHGVKKPDAQFMPASEIWQVSKLAVEWATWKSIEEILPTQVTYCHWIVGYTGKGLMTRFHIDDIAMYDADEDRIILSEADEAALKRHMPINSIVYLGVSDWNRDILLAGAATGMGER